LIRSNCAVSAFLFLLLGLPFLCFVHAFPFAYLPEYVFSASLVVLGFLFCLIKFWRERIPVSRLSLFFLLFFIVLVSVSVLGAAPAAGVRVLVLYGSVFFLASLLSFEMGRFTQEYYFLAAVALVVGGVVQALAAIALHYGLLNDSLGRWMPPPAGARMTGLLAQPNLLGLYLFCSYASLCYLYVCERISVGFLWAISLLLGFSLVGTGSRAGLLYLLISFSAALWFGFVMQQRRALVGLCSAFLIVLACIPLYWQIDSQLQPILHDLGYITRPAIGEAGRDYQAVGFRPSEWHKAWLMLLDNPWLGVGLDNYGVRSFWMGIEYPWAVTEGTFPTHSHNFFMQIGAEFGLVALLFSVFLFLYVIAAVWQAEKTPGWWLVVSVCGAFFVNAMLEYALWNLHFAILLVFFLVPFFKDYLQVILSRLVACSVFVSVLLLWLFISWVTLDIYKKSFIYGGAVRSGSEALDLQVAGEDSMWGGGMRLLQMKNILPSLETLDYQDKLTKEMMEWRPLNLVVFRRLHVLALRQDSPELIRISKAMARFYPGDVEAVRNYLLSQKGVEDTESAELIKRYLVR